MTNAKFNDLSKDGSEVMREENTFQITVHSYGNKTTMKFDTKLAQNLGTLKDVIGLAIGNGIKWKVIEWTTDDKGKRKMVEREPEKDEIPSI